MPYKTTIEDAIAWFHGRLADFMPAVGGVPAIDLDAVTEVWRSHPNPAGWVYWCFSTPHRSQDLWARHPDQSEEDGQPMYLQVDEMAVYEPPVGPRTAI